MKKILVIAPILSQWSDVKHIDSSLKFLSDRYDLTIVDPLSDTDFKMSKEDFFKRWRKNLKDNLNSYDIFMGFSLGGAVIQQNFDLFSGLNKKIILFSTPSFADEFLSKRLGEVISLIEEKSLVTAIDKKNKYVFYPNLPPDQDYNISDQEKSAYRLLFGLRVVLDVDARLLLKNATVPYLHLIGRESKLVNHKNVYVSSVGQFVSVPSAGMRVLQDNLSYCRPLIINFIEGNSNEKN